MVPVGIRLRFRNRLLSMAALSVVLMSGSAAGCIPGPVVEETPGPITLEGRLTSGRLGQLDCVWLVDDDGHRVEIRYPAGWRVHLDPVRLVDPAGRVVAREGDLIAVGGPDREGRSICGPDFFVADTVTVVAASP